MKPGFLERLATIRPDEWRRTILAALFFFFILFGYFMLRPARESLGVESGMDVVKYLYIGTLLVTAAANPLFSWLVSRFPRRVFVPLTYRLFMLNILIFFALFLLLRDASGDPTPARLWVSRVYYVWLTVFALFNTMVFWAVMADTFSLNQSRRLYPVIAVGGTLGALAGSTYAWSLADLMGTPWLVLSSLVLFECGVQTFKRLGAHALHSNHATRCQDCGYDLRGITTNICPECGSSPRDNDEHRVIGGGALDGLKRTLTSPYLLGISGYIICLTILSTFLYFAELRIVAAATEGTDSRTALFANVNLWTQLATLLVQLFVTGRLLRALGTGQTLMVLPVLAGAGFLALALAPSYALIVLAQAGYRAGKYAIARPARETLFTVVEPEDRYKSKAFVDTFVYRFGDVIGALGDTAAKSLAAPSASAAAKLGATLGAVAGIAIPVCVIWGGLGLWLGARQKRTRDAAARDA